MVEKYSKIESIQAIFDQLDSFEAIQRLIDDGEPENRYLECKSPCAPNLNKGLKDELSIAISGFSNSDGGVIIFGVSTTKHAHSGLDILSQIEEIGSIRLFKQQVDLAISTLSIPNIGKYRSKILKKNVFDTKGLLVVYIPSIDSDPVQAENGLFYLRSRDEFVEMPYETLKRMFSGSAGPDLSPIFYDKLVELQKDGSWKIPISLSNGSSAAAKDTSVSLTVNNPSSCDDIKGEGFQDKSQINPGQKVFMNSVSGPIYRGQNMLVGSLIVRMKKAKLAKRKLDLTINIFSTNMRAKTCSVSIQLLAQKGFSVRRKDIGYLY